MAYAYWKSGKTNDIATFDLYFRSVRILQHGMIRLLCVVGRTHSRANSPSLRG